MRARSAAPLAIALAATVLAGGAFAQNDTSRAQPPRGERPASVTGDGFAAAAPRAPLSIAFVNMEKVVGDHPETKLKTEELKREMDVRIQEQRQRAEKVRAMETDLDLLTEGSPEYLNRLRDIRRETDSIKLEEKILRAETQLKLVDAMKKIYQKCKDTVAEVAKERGYHVVAMFSSSEVSGRTRSELITDIITRPFIYLDPSLDITDVVIQRLK